MQQRCLCTTLYGECTRTGLRQLLNSVLVFLSAHQCFTIQKAKEATWWQDVIVVP